MFERCRRISATKSSCFVRLFAACFFATSSCYVATVPAAFAQSNTSIKTSGTNVLISKKDCDRVIRHVPADAVAFKPGVDVRGNSVASADLNGGSSIAMPDVIEFNLTIDVLNDLGISDDSPLAPEGEAVLGTVTYDMLSGAVTFNGKTLGDPELAVIAAGCRASQK